MAFANTILGILLLRNPDQDVRLNCEVEDTKDGLNHFWLFLKK
jgi:hypothetical protein